MPKNISAKCERFPSFIAKIAFSLAIFLWVLIYLGHYTYIVSRGTSVWNFNFTLASAESAFVLSLTIPIAFSLACFQFINNNKKTRLCKSPAQNHIQSLDTANDLALPFLFLYSVATFVFLGNFPLLANSKGESRPGQIIIIVLLVSCISFIQQASAIKFYIRLRFWFFVESFLLLNLLYTSRFYFLTAVITLFAINLFNKSISLDSALIRFIRSQKLQKSYIVVVAVILFFSSLLIQYSLSRAAFSSYLSFDIWDIVYQRSVEAIPATAENLNISYQCDFLSFPKSIFNGFSVFLPNSMKFIFPSATILSMNGAETVHGSFIDNFVSQYGCLPFQIKFIFLMSLYYLAFWLSFWIFSYNFSSSTQPAHVFASTFALFNQIIVLTRSPAEFWPLAILGFGLIIPWLVKNVTKSKFNPT